MLSSPLLSQVKILRPAAFIQCNFAFGSVLKCTYSMSSGASKRADARFTRTSPGILSGWSLTKRTLLVALPVSSFVFKGLGRTEELMAKTLGLSAMTRNAMPN